MKSKLLSQFIKFSFGGVVSALISFISTPIITAIVLPQEFGKASMFILAFSLLLNIVLLGADQSFVRFFYQDRFKSNISSLLYNSLAMPLGFSVLIIVPIISSWKSISVLLVGATNFKVVILLSLVLVFGVIERFSTLLIRMSQRAVLFSNLKIIQSLINVFTIVLYTYFFDSSFISIIYGSLISVSVVALLGIIMEHRNWFTRVNFGKSMIPEIMRYGLPFIPTFVISWIFEGIDKMALRHYSNFNEIGLYTAASKIVAILTLLQITFSNFWVPVAYEAYESNSTESKKLFGDFYRGLSVIFFVIAILVISCKDFIVKLFAKEYLQSSDIVPFLIFMPIMYALSEITVGGINFRNKTYWHLPISAFSATVNLIGVLLLVPKIGAKGAAISTGVAYIAFFYVRTIIASYYLKIDFKIGLSSISIGVLILIAFINTFSKNLFLCSSINLAGLLTIVILFKKDLGILFNYLIKNK